mgnify:CR=1 FL=1
MKSRQWSLTEKPKSKTSDEVLYLERFYPINGLLESIRDAAEKNNWKTYVEDKMKNVKTLYSGKEWDEYDHTEISLIGKYELLEKMKIKFQGISETDSLSVEKSLATPDIKINKFYGNLMENLKKYV